MFFFFSPTKTTDDGLYLPRILQVTNYQQMDAADTNSEGTTIKEEPASESENDDSYEVEEDDDGPVEVCAKSLFTKQPIRDYPWVSENQDEEENLENESLFMEGR